MNKFLKGFLFFMFLNLIFSMSAVAMDSSASAQDSFGPPCAITDNEMQLLLAVQNAQPDDEKLFEEVRHLLDLETNPNIVVEGQSPLLGAVLNKNIRMIYLLKSYGARADFPLDSDGTTVLDIVFEKAVFFVLPGPRFSPRQASLWLVVTKALLLSQGRAACEAE